MRSALLLLLLAASVTMYAQPVSMFQQSFTAPGKPRMDTPQTLLTNDKGLVSATFPSSTYQNPSSDTLVIFKTDMYGGLLWSNRIYNGNEVMAVNHMIETDSSEILIVGSTQLNYQAINEGWLVMLNANGSLKWSCRWNSPSDVFAEKALQLADGTFAIMARTYWTMYVIHCDRQGNILSKNEYNPNEFTNTSTDICKTSDGGFAWVMSRGLFNNIEPVVMKFDATLNLQWSTIVFAADTGYPMNMNPRIVQSSSGHYFLLSEDMMLGNQYDGKVNIVELDAAGQYVSAGAFNVQSPLNYGRLGSSDIVMTSENEITLLLYSLNMGQCENQINQACLLHIDDNYNILWQEGFKGATMYTVPLHLGTDSTYSFVIPDTALQARMIRTNKMGVSGCNIMDNNIFPVPVTATVTPVNLPLYTSTVTKTAETATATPYTLTSSYYCQNAFSSVTETAAALDADIYPNPFTSTITLSLPAGTTDATVSITDISGRVLMRQSILSNTATIGTQELSAGMYIVEIRQHDAVKKLKMVKQ